MALKDWKKDNENRWSRKETNKNWNSLTIKGVRNSNYKFVVKDAIRYGIKQFFKTKSEALKFVKSYMRKY